jgi:hypothetical protein
MVCSRCGTTATAEATFCAGCGGRFLTSEVRIAEGPPPRWRGTSIEEILDMKDLSKEEWSQIAKEFNEWRKTVTLTPIDRALTHNVAWEHYHAGYTDGFDAGINRALGIDQETSLEMKRDEVERELWSGVRRQKR